MRTVDVPFMERTAWIPQAGLAFAMLLASLGTSIANIALPALTTPLDASLGDVQWVVTAYLATLTASAVLVGGLGDRFGKKRLLVAGSTLFALAALGSGVAATLEILVVARAVQGIGAAVLMTISMALMHEVSDKDRVGRAMGVLATASALGTALGPSLGGILLATFGWRAIFLVQVPLAIFGTALIATTLPTVRTEQRTAAMPFWTGLTGRLVPHLGLNLLVAAVMMATLVIGPFYLGLGLGMSAVMVGGVMTVGPLLAIASGAPSGRLVDAWGAERVLPMGLALMALGAALLALAPAQVGVPGYVLAIAILTPGYQLFQAANNTAALVGVTKDRRGTVSGLLTLFRNLGLISGSVTLGMVFAVGVGTTDFAHAGPEAMAGGMRLAFLLAAGALVTACTLELRRTRRVGK